MEKLQATLRDLQRQEMDLLASLEAIDQQFEDLGFPLSTVLPKEDMREPSNQLELKRSGLRIGNELSFRGQEKAGELFRMIDSDCDGIIGYEDVRAMNAFNDHQFGMIRDGHYQSKAAFAVTMRSLGIPSIPSKEGQLSEEAFKLLRVRIDDHQPLGHELLALNLGLLPSYLTRWSLFKQRLAKVLDLRSHRLNEQELFSLQNRISAEEFQQVLSLSSILYLTEVQGDPLSCPPITPLSRVEVARLLLLAKRKAVALTQLQRVATKRMIAQKDYPFVLQQQQHRDEDSNQQHGGGGSIASSLQATAAATAAAEAAARLNVTFDDEEEGRVTVEDLRSVPHQTALALLLCLPFSRFNINDDCGHSSTGCSWYRWGMSLRSLFFSTIRELYHHHGRSLFALAGHVNDRLLFRDFVGVNQLSSELNEISSVKYSLSIGGSNGNGSSKDLSGLGVSFKLLRLDGGATAAPATANTGSSKKKGSNSKAAAVAVDTGGGGIDAAIKKLGGPPGAGTALCLDLLCKATASPEEITNTAIILRQCLLRQVEAELKAMQGSILGLFVLPAVNEGDDAPVIRIMLVWKRAVSVDRWLEHCLLPYKLIDLMPAMAGDIRTSIDLKELLSNRVNSLDDLCAVHVSGLVNYRRGLILAILQRMRLAFAAGLAPTATSAAPATTTTNTNSVASAASSVSTTTAHHAAVNDRGLFQDTSSINDDEKVRTKRKAALIPYYSTLKEWSVWMIGQLQPLGLSFILRRQYRSLSQFLAMIVIPRRLQTSPGYEELLSKPGAVRELITGWTGSLGTEMWKLFETLRTKLEAKKKQADAARLAALMTIAVKQQSVAVVTAVEGTGTDAAEAVTLARLQRLGVSEQEAVSAINSARAGNDSKHIIDVMENEQRDRDVLNLRCLEVARKTLLGIHAIDILSGRSKLAITCTGLDFLELLLPSDPPPMQRAVDDNQIKRGGGSGDRSRATSPEKR